MRNGDRRTARLRVGWRLAARLAVAIGAAPAGAHHSYAMFDVSRTETLKGIVKEFQWTNPHVFIEFDVPDEREPHGFKHYSIESGPIATLKAAGFTRTSMNPGDKVTLVVYPLRDGRKGGFLYKAILENGRTLTVGTGEERKSTR
jgi:hypothetical protein